VNFLTQKPNKIRNIKSVESLTKIWISEKFDKFPHSKVENQQTRNY
jgi:hypothetical protein